MMRLFFTLPNRLAIKTQLGLIKQTTGKDVKVEAVIDFTLLRQVLAETK